MNSLQTLVQGYLESVGFNIRIKGDEWLVADKPVLAQDRDTWLVWTIPSGIVAPEYESQLIRKIEKAFSEYPGAKGYILGWSRAGFSRQFLEDIHSRRVKFVVPIQFFDAAFNFEEARSAITAINDLRSIDILHKRVPQPYRLESVDSDDEFGDDLYRTLVDSLEKSTTASVHVVVGQAGIGKSFLFKAIFARLYENFKKNKQALGSYPRPIPLLPEHRKRAYGLRTELIVDSFLDIEVASPIGRDSFEWLLVNGFMIWLLDGLDELYTGDPEFFPYLLDLLTRVDSKAKVVICCRNSLLTTCDEFRDFREWCAGSKAVKVYHLLQWERTSQRHLAWLRLANKTPQSGDSDPTNIAMFLQQCDKSPTLKAIARLPYYCEVLLDLYKDNKLREFVSEYDLIEFVVEMMINRERQKGLLDDRVFITNGLKEWLETVAMSGVESGTGNITQDDAQYYAQLVIRDDISEDRRDQINTTLLQFPLFTAGAGSGLIHYAHEIVAGLLAAQGYLKIIVRDPARIGRLWGKLPDPDESIMLRYMASTIDRESGDAIIHALQSGVSDQLAFRNLLALLLMSRRETNLIRQINLNMESRDVSALRFHDRDLTGVSFRNTNLSNVVFKRCNLSKAMFEGSLLCETIFDSDTQLKDALFGDLGRVQSIYVGRRRLGERISIQEWVENATGRTERRENPCPTAQQMRNLFAKFVTPLGEPRRDWLNHSALLSGKRFKDAASIEECLHAAVQEGYLNGPDFRNRYRRADGDRYAELVRFVRDGRVSENLGSTLVRLCDQRGCLHRPNG